MFERKLATTLGERLQFYPGVVLLGPRQVGKTTLARAFAARQPGSLVLDLEREADRARLAVPELFLAQHRGRLVVLDEVQNLPDLFRHLRPEIDAERRPGRFLLLGSASGRLLQQSAESLAGRVSYLELTPLRADEAGTTDLATLQALWLRGGFPLAWTAPSDALSATWRTDFIETFLARDLPQWGVTVPRETLHRLWRMLAHLHGQLFNASQIGSALGGLSHTTVARYLDILIDTMMLRRLEPHFVNTSKRLVKSPKIYVRDSGLLHTLLGIRSVPDLQGHPVAGASWEGFVIEQIAGLAPEGSTLGFYRTAAGAELDLVLTHGSRTLAFEVKFSAAPKPTKGFWQALQDVRPAQAYVVAPIEQAYPLAEGVNVIPVADLPGVLPSALAG